MNFSEVIGQEAVKERLIQMVKEDRFLRTTRGG